MATHGKNLYCVRWQQAMCLERMKRAQVMARGERCVADALFVRDQILPLSLSSKRWAIAVYESFRVAELLVKGVICLSGYTPKEHHDVAALIDDLIDRVSSSRPRIPFLLGARMHGGHTYGVFVDGNAVSLWKLVHGTMTVIAVRSNVLRSPLAALRLGIEVVPPPRKPRAPHGGALIRVRLDDDVLIEMKDASLTGPFETERRFVVPAEQERIDAMRLLAERLRGERESAFYSEREYAEADALRRCDHR